MSLSLPSSPGIRRGLTQPDCPSEKADTHTGTVTSSCRLPRSALPDGKGDRGSWVRRSTFRTPSCLTVTEGFQLRTQQAKWSRDGREGISLPSPPPASRPSVHPESPGSPTLGPASGFPPAASVHLPLLRRLHPNPAPLDSTASWAS